MDMRGYQRYREDAVHTMTPGERLTIAELELKKQNYPAFEAAVDRSLAIVHYFEDTLDRQYPISRDLARLYEYLCYELGRVKIGRNETELARVKGMAGELRDSFRQAEKNVASEGAGQ